MTSENLTLDWDSLSDNKFAAIVDTRKKELSKLVAIITPVVKKTMASEREEYISLSGVKAYMLIAAIKSIEGMDDIAIDANNYGDGLYGLFIVDCGTEEGKW